MASHTLKSRDALTQCPCFSLHKRCNPITCNKAPSREKLAQESSQTGSIPPRWAVGCTLSALRRSALQGCFTCGIYYAGLSIPGYFAYRGNEDHIQVKIKNNGADVYAYNTANDYVYGELEFFTIKESSECITQSVQDWRTVNSALFLPRFPIIMSAILRTKDLLEYFI